MEHKPIQDKQTSASSKFQLEEIIKEFAPVKATPKESPLFSALPVEEEGEKKPTVFAPLKIEGRQISEGTVSPAPPEEEEEVLRTFTPRKKAKSVREELEQTRPFTPVELPQPSPSAEGEDEEGVKVVHSLKDVKVKPSRKPKEPPIRIIVETIPEEETPRGEKPAELLQKARKQLGNLLLRRVFLGLDALLGMFVLLYDTKQWAYFPWINEHGQVVTLGLLLLGLFLALPVVWRGIRDLFRFRISLYTQALTASIVCLIYSVTCMDAVYAPLVTLQLFFLMQALVSENAADFYTAKTLSEFRSPMGVCNAPQLLENTDSLRRNPGDVEDFMERLSRSSFPQDLLCVYASILLFLLPILSYFLSRDGEMPFIQTWLLLLLGTLPYGGMQSFSKPFRILARRLNRYGGALCGWHGARIFGGKHTIILRDGDLFPKKGIASNGMKIYHSFDAAKVISYALAALEKADSPLVGLFEALLQEHYGKHSRVGEYRFYEQGGVGVEVGNDIVLVGNLGFIRSMGISVPVGTRVRQAVYVSVNGVLAGIFAIRYKANASTRTGLHDVLANRNFSIVLATRDFLITPELIAAKYTLPTDTMVFPEYSERLRLSATNAEQAMEQGALIAEDTFGALAVTVAAGRTLRNASLVAVALSIFAGILGLLLCIVLIAWHSVAVSSPMHIVAFQILWGLVTGFVGFVFLRF